LCSSYVQIPRASCKRAIRYPAVAGVLFAHSPAFCRENAAGLGAWGYLWRLQVVSPLINAYFFGGPGRWLSGFTRRASIFLSALSLCFFPVFYYFLFIFTRQLCFAVPVLLRCCSQNLSAGPYTKVGKRPFKEEQARRRTFNSYLLLPYTGNQRRLLAAFGDGRIIRALV